MKKNEETMALVTIVFLALSLTGFTYAEWNDSVLITNTMTFGNWTRTTRFVHPLDWFDNEIAVDVGQANCHYTEADPVEGYEKLVIEISNAYPSYAVDCHFTLKNVGTDSSEITAVRILDPSSMLNWEWTNSTEGVFWKDFDGDGVHDAGEEILNVTITHLLNVDLDPGATMSATTRIHVADGAEDCHTYNLEVQIEDP